MKLSMSARSSILALVALSAFVLVACQEEAEPVTIIKEVPVEVIKEVEVEKEVIKEVEVSGEGGDQGSSGGERGDQRG